MRRFSKLFIVAAIAIAPACSQPSKDDALRAAASMQIASAPVKFEELQTFLPSVSYLAAEGWERHEVTGMMLSEPLKGSQTSMTLSRGEAKATIKIVDTMFNQSMHTPVASFLASNYGEGDASHYKKSTTLQNFSAFEEWDSKERSGSLTVFADKRFLVLVQGSGLNSIDALRALTTQIDLTKLSQLK